MSAVQSIPLPVSFRLTVNDLTFGPAGKSIGMIFDGVAVNYFRFFFGQVFFRHFTGSCSWMRVLFCIIIAFSQVKVSVIYKVRL